MKNKMFKINIVGIAAGTLLGFMLFALSGCENPAGPDAEKKQQTGYAPQRGTLGELASYPQNTPLTPYLITPPGAGAEIPEIVEGIITQINSAGKYVALDFSSFPSVETDLKGSGLTLATTVSDVSADKPWLEAIKDKELITGLVLPPISGAKVGDLAFSKCKYLRSVTIPANVTNIGTGAFYGCEALENITLPTGVTAIGQKAFTGCKALVSITLPQGITTIPASTFSGCASLESVTLPSGLLTIAGGNNFAGCTSLRNITIPANLTAFSTGAFKNCTSLTGINIPSGVAIIEANLFEGCSSLAGISLHSSITQIKSAAFKDCTSLTGIDIPAGVKLANSAFGGAGLRSVQFGANVVLPSSGGDSVFSGCENLESVTLPATWTSITQYTFQDCKSLTSITIPAAVTTIRTGAFKGCSKLSEVIFEGGGINHGSTTNWASNAFPGNDDLKTAYAASGAGRYTRPAPTPGTDLAAYGSTTGGWSKE